MARPREFDPDVALDKAMRQFWAKGYHDTSIRDLVDKTGVNYYGLYEVFDNKHGLLLAALDRYRQTITAEFATIVAQAAPTRAGLLRAFDQVFDLLKTEDGQVGCMMCNAAIELAPHDEDVATKVRDHLKLLAAIFEGWLTRYGKSGADARNGAEFLASTAYSLALLMRAGFDRRHVKRQAATALNAVL